MKNLEIASIFGNMADLLEIKGANRFRVRAYRNARSSLEVLTDNVEEIAKRDALKDISGIGKDLAAKIVEYIQTGRIQAFEDLKRELPIGLVSIVTIPTIGPKTARAIFDHTGVSSVEDLEKLALSEELLTVPGIKKKTLENIVSGIGLYKRRKGLFLLGRALPLAKDICEILSPLTEQVAYAGSLRRMRETVHDIDILAAAPNPQKIMREFTGLPMVERVLVSGETKTSVLIADDLQVDLRVVDLDSWGAALAYFTGSKEHNIRLRERALKRGLKLNEYGLYDSADTAVAAREEADIYEALDLPWIPPCCARTGERLKPLWKEASPNWFRPKTFRAICTCTQRGVTARYRQRLWWRPPAVRVTATLRLRTIASHWALPVDCPTKICSGMSRRFTSWIENCLIFASSLARKSIFVPTAPWIIRMKYSRSWILSWHRSTPGFGRT